MVDTSEVVVSEIMSDLISIGVSNQEEPATDEFTSGKFLYCNLVILYLKIFNLTDTNEVVVSETAKDLISIGVSSQDESVSDELPSGKFL